jgi:hypothetical protein
MIVPDDPAPISFNPLVLGIVTLPVQVHEPASTVMVSPSLALLMAVWIAEFVQPTAPTVEGQKGGASDTIAIIINFFIIHFLS